MVSARPSPTPAHRSGADSFAAGAARAGTGGVPRPFATLAEAAESVVGQLEPSGVARGWVLVGVDDDLDDRVIAGSGRVGDLPQPGAGCPPGASPADALPDADPVTFGIHPPRPAAGGAVVVAVPVPGPDGLVHAVLCGLGDTEPPAAALEALRPTLVLHARLLATVLAGADRERDAAATTADLYEAVRRDALTGLGNRRRWDELVADHAGRRAVGVLAIDLDDFKEANDRHGHAYGDRVLRAAAQAVSEAVRPQDAVLRLGGDEIAVVLDGCGPEEARRLAGRVRDRVAGAGVAASVGWAARVDGEGLEAVHERADGDMYREKGRRAA